MSQLIAIGLIEKDTNDLMEFTWLYPMIELSTRHLLVRKCPLSYQPDSGACIPYLFGHFEHFWYYLLSSKFDNKEYSAYVTDVCLAILCKDFHPEKYKDILTALLHTFVSSISLVAVLTSYLSLFSKKTLQVVGVDEKVLNIGAYNPRKAFIASPLKPIIQQFGVESILLYNALILKRRVVVYSSQLETLLTFSRTLPLLALHRQNWDILYPYVDLVEQELASLQKLPNYIAGFLDPSVENHTDLYDLFVNVSSSTISIAEHAKGIFTLSKAHKEIAKLMLEVANDPDKSDQQAIKEINLKTKEMLTNLKSLSVQEDGIAGAITYEALKKRKFTPAMENFLFTLATAEGLTQL